MKARWWKAIHDASGAVVRGQCGLCIHGCTLGEGKTGLCGVRHFTKGALYSPYLGKFSARAVDPIEKKPLYHWRPGTSIYSLGSLGCTMRCPFCQNSSIAHPTRAVPLLSQTIDELIADITRLGLNSVAYTYNEPALQAEYILEAAPRLLEQGIATVLVTNGMYSHALLEDLTPWVAAANVDVKTFSPRTYSALGGSLDTVKHTVEHFFRRGVHVELTTLVVPGVSDSLEEFEAMVQWISSLSSQIPLHISRYFPAYTFTAPATDIGVLNECAALAKKHLEHVHLGNVR